MKLVTQRAYAGLRKVSPQYISRLVKEGVITLQDGKINPDTADKAIEDWSSRIHDTPGKIGSNEVSDDSIATHRKRQIKVVTSLKQLQLDEERGKLVNIDELRAEFGKLFVDIKTRIRAIASKVSQEVAVIKLNSNNEKAATVAVQKIIMFECDEALKELSQWRGKSKKSKGGKKK